MVHAIDPRSIPRSPTRFNLKVIREIKTLTTEPGPRRRRRLFSSTQDEEIQKMRALRHQNTMRGQERLKELSSSDPEYAKSLDIKECMLEVQGILMGTLAAEQNHFTGQAVLPNLCIVDFDERVKEVEEMIQALQY